MSKVQQIETTGVDQSTVAEFMGTFALVFVGAGSFIADQALPGGLGVVGRALALGLTMAAMFYALAHVSGGHFNPAVTFGFLVARRISAKRAGTYVVGQLLGALAAGMVLKTLIPSGLPGASTLGAPTLYVGLTPLAGLLIEFFLAFFLVLVFFSTTVDQRSPKVIAGLAIGLTVSANMIMGAPWTGGIANPALAFGPTVAVSSWEAFGRVTSLLLWEHQYIYWVGALFGGGLAALIYKMVLLKEDEA